MLRDDAHTSGDLSRYNNRSWAAITHVSRMWRPVALEYAPRWNVLYLGYKAQNIDVGTMLARSKDAPLTIIVYADDVVEGDIYEATNAFSYAIEHHSYCLKALDIHSYTPNLFTDALLSPCTLPILKSIQCRNTGGHMELDLLHADTALCFPSLTVLALWNVTLHCASMDFQASPPFLNLIDFHLMVEEGSESLKQDPKILGFLSKMPALQKLSIRGAFPPSASSTAKTITLPRSLTPITFRWDHAATSNSGIAFLKKLHGTNASVACLVPPLSALSLAREYFGISRPPEQIFISVTSNEHASIPTGRRHSTAISPTEIWLDIEFDDEDQIDDIDGGVSLSEICAKMHLNQLATIIP